MSQSTPIQANVVKDATTDAVARFVCDTPLDAISAGTLHNARRAIHNWFALVLHAADHPAVDIARRWALGQGGQGATMIGGHESSALWAAMVNGLASHVEDFDDTHYATIVHPTGPVWSAVLAVAQRERLTGADALHAFVLGVDVQCRLALAVYPSHYDRGYHITATAGAVGGAAAVGRLLRLPPEQMGEAIGLASTFASGLKGTFGAMAKPMHPGKAAMEAITAAELAAQGFTAGDTGFESRLGFCQVLADGHDLAHLRQGLGERWLIDDNAIKPFACGVVAHAAIDGILRHREAGLTAADVQTVELRVHPRVQELTGNPSPRLGLEGKFSVQHSVAAALLDGRTGPSQYTDERVQDREVVDLRDRVRLTVDSTLRLDEAHVTVTRGDGTSHAIHVEHAVSSLDNPMSDAQLQDKVEDLLRDVARDKREQLSHLVEGLPAAATLTPLAALLS